MKRKSNFHLWKVRKTYKVLKQPAVTNRLIGRTSIIGEYGEIYRRSKKTLWVRCWKPVIANLYLRDGQKTYGLPEGTFYVPNSDLELWMKRMKAFPTQELQAEFANKRMSWRSLHNKRGKL